MIDQQLGTVVICGSHAGLAVGYFLKQRDLPFVILDENDRIGDAWRKRWDSLRLFTPGRYNGLPGMPFPGSPWAFPTKDETADYLEAYARAFEFPVRTGVKVDRLAKTGDRFEVRCGQHTLFAENVVVATGAFNNPRVPSFARDLDKSINQLHSKQYRNPFQIQKGAVLVVGAGNSGAEIAIELARHHQTILTVSNVIWCTGFRPDYHWIDLSLPTHHGLPIHDRGIVESCSGLYFMGLLFLYSLSSALVGGVGRDAEHIVDHIVSTRLSSREGAVARATTAARQYA